MTCGLGVCIIDKADMLAIILCSGGIGLFLGHWIRGLKIVVAKRGEGE